MHLGEQGGGACSACMARAAGPRSKILLLAIINSMMIIKSQELCI